MPHHATSSLTWSAPQRGSSTSRISTLPGPFENFTRAFIFMFWWMSVA